MQKKNQNKSKLIKEIILYILVTILVILLVFAEDIIKLIQKNTTNLAQNSETEIITNEPNAPMLSAGMIPIKWNGENWTITTTKDSEWYDYRNGKLAYIMLNDGTYQSELVQNMEENRQKLAEENVNIPIQPDELGTIFVWIPRFAYNEEGDMTYIKNIGIIEENWTIPDIFADKHIETAPDFLLTGIWVEKDVDNECESKIIQMNQEESVYGFIKNTMAIQIDQVTENEIQTYINTLSTDLGTDDQWSSLQTQENANETNVTDITNPNRIILKIIKQSNQTPIKATGFYNEETEKAEIKVTYTQFGISKILCDNEEIEFQIQKQNRTSTVTIEGEYISKGKHVITIIDNQNNKTDILIYKLTIYAFLYSDGTLTFSTSETPESDKELVNFYGDINETPEDIPWFNERESIIAVDFKDKIYPKATRNWFYGCSNLTTINNIYNLNTAKVTSMYGMFNGCTNLTSLDVSKFDTRNVTNMSSMFFNCTSLTSLSIRNFNTANVTDMNMMFWNCTSLTSLDMGYFYNVSNVTNMFMMFENCKSLKTLNLRCFYNTSNVTNMRGMFSGCTSLTSLDVSNFDTRSVTVMRGMFESCDNLASLNLKSFDTSNVTDMTYMFAFNYKLKKIYVSKETWNTSNADTTDMFLYCGTSSVTKQ